MSSRSPTPPARADDSMRRIRAVSHLMDDVLRVPGTRWRFGADALIGLIPGVGDTAGAVVSAYLLMEAGRLGVPRATLLRMAGNVALEAVVGTVPFLGDLFDAGWKANLRNVRLMEAHLASPVETEKASRGFLIAVVVGVVLLLLVAAAIAGWLVINALDAIF